MFFKNLSIGLFFILLSGTAFGAALDTVRIKAATLNEVEVTSSKDNKKTGEMASSITLLNPTELSNLNITSIKDISAVVPNLFFPDYGSKLTSPVYIRGIGSKINAPSVGLYVDGIPYFEKALFDFEFNEIERIEVLRGPQGTLYGRNTMGGIIQIITKNPLYYHGAKLSLSGGNYGKRDAAVSYYGKILPNLGFSVAGKYNHSDGYFVNQYTQETADKLDALNGSVKLVFRASNTLNISLNTQYDYLKQNGYPYALIDSTGRIGAVNYDSVSSYKRSVFSTALLVNKLLDGVMLKSATSLQTLSDLQSIDQDFSVNPFYFVTQKQKQTLWTEELEARSTQKGKYEWLLGVFAFNQTALNHLKVNSNLKDYDVPTRGLAIYHQSTFNHLFWEDLSLTAGLRYDYEKGSQAYLSRKPVAGVLTTLADLKTDLSFTQWSPKVSLQYRLNPGNMLYTSVTKGYKTGGFNTSFDTPQEQTFKPEFSWNYEIGSKYRIFNNRASGELALFYTDWKNQQIAQPLLTGVGSKLRNAGSSYSKGLEFALQASIQNDWNASLSYGYTEAKFVDYVSGTFTYSGNYIPYIPRHTWMLGSDYTLRLKHSYFEKVVFNGQYVETGTLYWNDKNTASQTTYGFVNGKISFAQKHLIVDLWVKNALASDYTAFYFEVTNQSFGQKGKPRTMGATLTLLMP